VNLGLIHPPAFAGVAGLIVIVMASPVAGSYLAFGIVFLTGLAVVFMRGDWRRARGLEQLILFGPIFYAAPVAGFGAEHFTLTDGIASIIPAWIPWHVFWTLLLGACFIAGGLSLVTGIQARLTATLFGITFFLFVALMHGPSWAHDPHNRTALTVALRETSFSGGAFALAGSLSDRTRQSSARWLATLARYFVAIPVLFFSVEQFLHGSQVPGVPLERITPAYVLGHSIWTYAAAVVYAIAGVLLLVNRKTRPAAAWLGLTVFLIELLVYVPIGAVDRASLGNGFNYMADTLMFCGAVLLLAGAMPCETVSASTG